MRVGLIGNVPGRSNIVESRLRDYKAEQISIAVGGNSGNVAYVDGLRSCIADPIVEIDWSTPRALIEENCDILVVACANQLGEHTDLSSWAAKIDSLGIPVALVGLGAQADKKGDAVNLSAGTESFLRATGEHKFSGVPNIAVRGPFSEEVLLKRQISSVPLGCPSLFINPTPNLGARISEVAAASKPGEFALAAGNPYSPLTVPSEINLTKLLARYGGTYIVQHPIKMLQLALADINDMASDQFAFLRERTVPYVPPEDFRAWRVKNVEVFINSATWIERLKQYTCVIGARYHGVALGVQAVRPSVVIYVDSRTQELAEQTGIPTISFTEAEGLESTEFAFKAWSPDVGARFDDNRVKLSQRFVDFLVGNGITPSRSLDAVAHQVNLL